MLSPEEEARFSRLADLAESDTPLPTEGNFTHHYGAASVAEARRLFQDAVLEPTERDASPGNKS